jgi:c-di-GMP-binding flagellar brake protein YcgR
MAAFAPLNRDARKSPRLKLPPMYTVVQARPVGESRFRWTGYVYDISATGMRLELDEELAEGSQIEIRAVLPGSNKQTTVRATGRIVRRHEDPFDPGPVRMGLAFDDFGNQREQRRLADYLSRSGVRAA